MKNVVIVDGLRTPYIKAGTLFSKLAAVDLGKLAMRELLARTNMRSDQIDEVIVGNIAQPPEATNVARIIALESGIPKHVPAFTVQRNCASGMQAIADAYLRISSGMADVIVAGGVESMSNIPLLFAQTFTDKFAEFYKARSFGQKIGALSKLKLRDLKPVVGLQLGLTDGFCGLNMGETAEVLAKEYNVSRKDQDEFALMSHQRATKATDDSILKQEIVPVYLPPAYKNVVDEDNGIRKNQSMEALAKLRPVFDRRFGTVTAGNSSQITDGAAFVLVMSEEKAKALDCNILGYIRGFGFAGLDPERMGLGPVFSTPIALKRAGLTMKDIQLIEMNEAFAAQVIANERCFASKKFANEKLDLPEPLGEIDRARLNVNGGAIALGHPVGSSATRLIVTLLKEMKRRQLQFGLATLCIGGGQGGAMVLERKN
ncbi:thiolase family protein [bacterium]|nr:thiolase family protein [bacterium]